MNASLSCVFCGDECWHNSKTPTPEFLERVAAARGWKRRDGLPDALGPKSHWECDRCQRLDQEKQRCQD